KDRAGPSRETEGRPVRGTFYRGSRPESQSRAAHRSALMAHVLEHATTGRATCRGCGNKILKDELRFGEKQPNAFGDGEMTLWFHLTCAAYKRPEPFLEMLARVEEEEISTDEQAAARALQPAAEFGIEHRRLPRLDKADQA